MAKPEKLDSPSANPVINHGCSLWGEIEEVVNEW